MSDTGVPNGNATQHKLRFVECPDCDATGHQRQGYTASGEPIHGRADCERCRRVGFVPELDGKPSYPYGRDAEHPIIVERNRRFEHLKRLKQAERNLAAKRAAEASKRDDPLEQGALL